MSQALQENLEFHDYQQSQVIDMKGAVQYHNCHSNIFPHGLYSTLVRLNVLHVDVDHSISTDPQVIIDNYTQHYTTLFNPKCFLNNA